MHFTSFFIQHYAVTYQSVARKRPLHDRPTVGNLLKDQQSTSSVDPVDMANEHHYAETENLVNVWKFDDAMS